MFNEQNNNDEVDVVQEIDINYVYNKNPIKGYQYARTSGMERYGCPELYLMDYYNPDEASYILLNMADLILNGDFYDPETGEYDFFSVVDLTDEAGNVEYEFGFIGGWVAGEESIHLQLLNENNRPVHPGEDFLPSWSKRGFDVFPMFMYLAEEEQEQ